MSNNPEEEIKTDFVNEELPKEEESAPVSMTVTRAWRRANVLGMKKVIKKLQKGYTPEKIARQLGLPLEAVVNVQAILKIQASAQENPLPADSKVFIDGEEL